MVIAFGSLIHILMLMVMNSKPELDIKMVKCTMKMDRNTKEMQRGTLTSK